MKYKLTFENNSNSKYAKISLCFHAFFVILHLLATISAVCLNL